MVEAKGIEPMTPCTSIKASWKCKNGDNLHIQNIRKKTIALAIFLLERYHTMQAYQRIQISLKLYEKPVGNVRLYKRVLKHCGYDEHMADEFILSKKGGFSQQELARVKTFIRYEKKRYPKRKKACAPL